MRWSALLEKNRAGSITIDGRIHEGWELSVESLLAGEAGKQPEQFILEPAKTLVLALGNLSAAPAPAIRFMAAPRPANSQGSGVEGKPFLGEYIKLALNALTWNVETPGGFLPERFTQVTVKFEYNAQDAPARAVLRAMDILPEGIVCTDADATVFGLGARKVLLKKNLGMMRSASIECRATRDGKNIPSLKVAYDLYGTIPVLYEKERKKKNNRGKPLAARKG